MVLVDGELSAKLASESQLEKEMRDLDEMPTIVKDYLENGPFQVCRVPGGTRGAGLTTGSRFMTTLARKRLS